MFPLINERFLLLKLLALQCLKTVYFWRKKYFSLLTRTSVRISIFIFGFCNLLWSFCRKNLSLTKIFKISTSCGRVIIQDRGKLLTLDFFLPTQGCLGKIISTIQNFSYARWKDIQKISYFFRKIFTYSRRGIVISQNWGKFFTPGFFQTTQKCLQNILSKFQEFWATHWKGIKITSCVGKCKKKT